MPSISTIGHARAHDHQHPELNSWYESLYSGKGPCCDGSDAKRVDDADWETKDGHYRVRLDGEWVDVPNEAVVDGPNRAGRTMVWHNGDMPKSTTLSSSREPQKRQAVAPRMSR